MTEDAPEDEEPKAETETEDNEDEDSVVEEEEQPEKKEKKKIEKTVWDWERMNEAKPLWLRKPAEVEESEYKEFYKSFTKVRSDSFLHTLTILSCFVYQ